MHGAASPSHTHETVSRSGIDASFLHRVHLSSLILAVLFGASIAVYREPLWGAGFAVSAFWSVANLWSLERLIRVSLRPSGRKASTILIAMAIKLPLLYALLVLMLVRGNFPAMSLIAGLSVPLVVIFLKVAGQALAPRIALPSNRRSRTTDPS